MFKYTYSTIGVRISMDTFVKRFQPEKYSAWLDGNDFGHHPAVASEYLPAPVPTVQDILINKNNTNIPQSVMNSLRTKGGNHQRFQRSNQLQYSKMYPDINVMEIKNRTDVPQHVKLQF